MSCALVGRSTSARATVGRSGNPDGVDRDVEYLAAQATHKLDLPVRRCWKCMSADGASPPWSGCG